MSRLVFPSDRLVYGASPYVGAGFTSSAGEVATVYSDSAGTTLADVQNLDGSANAAATFTVDTTSRLPLFLGPAAGTDTLYVQVGTGPVTPLYAVTSGDISAAVGAEVANRVAGDATNAAAITAETTRATAAEAANTTALAAKAPLASPALTGNPTAPTQTAANNSTRIATTAYADAAVAAQHVLDGGAYVSLTDAPADIKRSAGPLGHTYALTWQVTGSQGVSGTRGLVFSRDASAYPVGMTFRDEAVGPLWDIGVDATTTQLVLAYSHQKASGPSDMIRGDVEGHWNISDTAGAPDGTCRLNLESTAADAATITTLEKMSVASGSPLNASGKFLRQATVAGATVHQITYQGFASFGFSYGNTLPNAAVEASRGVVVRSTDANATVWLARRGVSSQDWVMEIDSTTSNQWVLKDNGSGRRPLVFRSTAADGTIFADTNGLILGASAQKIGFGGATPITKPTRPGQLTDSSGGTSGGATIAVVTDIASAANAIATLAAKVNAIEVIPHNYGLVT